MQPLPDWLTRSLTSTHTSRLKIKAHGEEMLDFTFFPGWVHKKGGVKVIIDSVHVISDAASPVSRHSHWIWL